jgi:hypothetical protein
MRSRFLGWALSALLVSGVAGAGEEARGGSDAERLFEEGRALMLDHRFEEACPKIAESQRLEPRVGTLLNLAVCYEQTGKVATAWVHYQQVLTSARAEGQTERERLATERIAAIEARVPWLTVGVTTGEPMQGLSVHLDGAPLEPMAWNREMPVDPGEHRVMATAPERKAWDQRFRLREGQRMTIEVPLLPPVLEAKRDVPASPVVVEAPVSEQREAEPERSPWLFEIGLLAGFLSARGGRAEPQAEPRSIAIYDPQGTYSDCGHLGCSYTLNNNTGALVALHGSVSHALSDSMGAGVRMLFGPRLGKGGGSVFAIGPSLSVQMTDDVWMGVAGLIGEATVGGYGEVVPPANSYARGDPHLMDSSMGAPAWGALLEVGVTVLRLPQGSLGVSTMPMFLQGSGTLWCVPGAVSYRF